MSNRLGMSRADAKKQAPSHTWDSLRELLVAVRPRLVGVSESVRSRVNKAMSVSYAFNIMWKAVGDKTGSFHPRNQLIAVNILREFGTATPKVTVTKELPELHSEPLMEIHE